MSSIHSSARTISKLNAANRQIEVAIRMYFDDDDNVAIHTLGCAAREIYEKKHCGLAEIGRFYDHIAAAYPENTEKKIFNVLNNTRNFFKHPDPEGI